MSGSFLLTLQIKSPNELAALMRVRVFLLTAIKKNLPCLFFKVPSLSVESNASITF